MRALGPRYRYRPLAQTLTSHILTKSEEEESGGNRQAEGICGTHEVRVAASGRQRLQCAESRPIHSAVNVKRQ